MCYYSCQEQKITIYHGFILISNSWLNPRWQPLFVTSQVSSSASTHKIYLILFRDQRLSTEGKIVLKHCNISKTMRRGSIHKLLKIICVANTPNLVNTIYAIRGPAYPEKIWQNCKRLNVLEILSDGENFEQKHQTPRHHRCFLLFYLKRTFFFYHFSPVSKVRQGFLVKDIL